MRNSRSLTSSGSDERRMSKRRCTAFDTLLTFCPPAPCARVAESSISTSGMAMPIPPRLTNSGGARVELARRGRRRGAAGAGVARLRQTARRAIAVDARPLDREIARARGAGLGRLAVGPVLAPRRAQVARRGDGVLVGRH